MNIEEINKKQEEEYRKCLKAILSSSANKKIIVAGPGTGKTSIFKSLLDQNRTSGNLVMTFIRKLTSDMEEKLGDKAEVKTFHAYCKKILHKQVGEIELVPYLPKIIKKDAAILEKDLNDFDTKLRTLDERSPEISFYLERGDYYKTIGFDDSVYRVLKLAQNDGRVLPMFNQILIDEFQDFNRLEVAFINELEKRGNILLVGDDDQAVYDNRSSSPDYIRDKYNSGQYVIFELPFSFRCTKVIIDSVNLIIQEAQKLGKLKGRIDKKIECFLPKKEKDSNKYPRIIFAQCSVLKTVAKFIEKEISNIDQSEIIESNDEKEGYPTVLIIGQKQYLKTVYDVLSKKYRHISFKPSEGVEYSPADAYELLKQDDNSNLGWRVLIEFFNKRTLKRIIKKTEDGKLMFVDAIGKGFIKRHKQALKYLRDYKNGQKLSTENTQYLKNILRSFYKKTIRSFTPIKKEEKKFEKDEPTIILTSRKGCKGLSAGFVFILGINNREFPRKSQDPSDIEIAELIVGLSRTRKCCYFISNKWLISPIDSQRSWRDERKPSMFISWIPKNFIQNRGYIRAKDIE